MSLHREGRQIVLTVAYDGTDFYGFQRQSGTGLPTIQASLEDAIYRLSGERVTIEGSGRTDTGVHAWGQVVHFYSTSSIPPQRWFLALASYLPDSIIIRESKEGTPGFHARFSALEKTYLYQYYLSPTPSPFYRRYAYHVPYHLDVAAMQNAAHLFEGSHDFQAFCAAGAKVNSYVREIYACFLEEDGLLLKLTIRGNGFLWNMVRIIAGTLLEVGSGKRRVQDIPVLIGLGDRTQTGVTLPPQGLILHEVKYPLPY